MHARREREYFIISITTVLSTDVWLCISERWSIAGVLQFIVKQRLFFRCILLFFNAISKAPNKTKIKILRWNRSTRQMLRRVFENRMFRDWFISKVFQRIKERRVFENIMFRDLIYSQFFPRNKGRRVYREQNVAARGKRRVFEILSATQFGLGAWSAKEIATCRIVTALRIVLSRYILLIS